MEALTRVYALPYPPTSAGHVNDRPFYRWAGTSPPLGASGSGCAGSGLWGEHEVTLPLIPEPNRLQDFPDRADLPLSTKTRVKRV